MTFKRILIIRLDEIGDVMTCLPAIDAVTQKYPDAEVTVWCTPVTAVLFRHHPRISKISTSEKELNGTYDLVADLRGNYQTILFALLHSPRYRLDRGSVRLRNKFFLKQHPHEIQVNFQVIEPLGIQRNTYVNRYFLFGSRNEKSAENFMDANTLRRFTVLHPFSMKKLKEWPPANFEMLAKLLHEQHHLDIVFIGTEKERPSIEKMQANLSFRTFAFAGYPLDDLAALIARSALMIGNDSGPMHIADALNIPVVALFGPGEPHLFAPSGKQSGFIHHKLECNPCDQVHCVHPENPCMNRIQVSEVIQKINELNLLK